MTGTAREAAAAGERAERARGTWAVVAVHVLFVAGVGLSTTFVNVYLWRVGGGLGVVLHYHLALFLALVPGGALGGWIVGRRDRVAALRLGIAAHAVFFLAVLLLGPRSPAFAWPLGALMGVGMGFYYVAASVMVLDLTGEAGAGPLVGAMDQARLAAMTITPFVAAFAIDRLTPARGYPAVFAASVVLFVAAAAYSQRLAARRDGRPLALGATLVRPPRPWRRFLFAQGLRGVRDGVFLFLAGILVFERTRSEFELGLFALGSGAVSWLATRAVAVRVGTRRRRMRLMAAGVALSVAAALSLAFVPGRLGVAAFGLLEALAVPLVAVPFSSESYAIAGADPGGRRRGVGYMVAREVPLNLGRLTGVALLFAVVEGLRRPYALGWVLVAVTAANVAAWLVLWGGRGGRSGLP
ncbi:MAG: hypothetical protein K6V73_07535 [Firmicutes bacterium]|nr:hypothetical protein [Bacillota bacterium]